MNFYSNHYTMTMHPLFLIIPLCALLLSCGQKGPLYLPKPTKALVHTQEKQA